MTRLVIVTYGQGRIFHEYINASTDAEALALAVRQLRDEGHDPHEALVLAGSAAIHDNGDGGEVWDASRAG